MVIGYLILGGACVYGSLSAYHNRGPDFESLRLGAMTEVCAVRDPVKSIHALTRRVRRTGSLWINDPRSGYGRSSAGFSAVSERETLAHKPMSCVVGGLVVLQNRCSGPKVPSHRLVA